MTTREIISLLCDRAQGCPPGREGKGDTADCPAHCDCEICWREWVDKEIADGPLMMGREGAAVEWNKRRK